MVGNKQRNEYKSIRALFLHALNVVSSLCSYRSYIVGVVQYFTLCYLSPVNCQVLVFLVKRQDKI